MSVSHKNMLLRICKTASKIIVLPTQPVSQLTQRAMVTKAHAVASDLTSVQNAEKKRFKNSFVPQAIIRACMCVFIKLNILRIDFDYPSYSNLIIMYVITCLKLH